MQGAFSRVTPGAAMAVGWREWVALPELGIPAIKTKIDTGARTSALHTFDLDTYHERGREYVRFLIHPLQKRTDIEIQCVAPIIDRRIVRDSGGHPEERLVIETPVLLGDRQWTIEITLTSREDMLFRMLLGRRAIVDGNLIIDPCMSYLKGRDLPGVYRKLSADRASRRSA